MSDKGISKNLDRVVHDNVLHSRASTERKRYRVQLSCAYCRQKKLKCNRGQPCDNCSKRNQPQLCQYTSPLIRNRPTHSRQALGPQSIPDRIRHLEDLVLSLRNQTDEPQLESPDVTEAGPFDGVDPKLPSAIGSPGTMLVDETSTRWFEATHWQAILDDIEELKESTEMFQRIDNDTPIDSTEQGNACPDLFALVTPFASKSALLDVLPSRPVTDRLISRLFNSKEGTTTIVHIPTFYREYMQFWENREEASVTWLSLLFSIICHSIFVHARVGDELPGVLGEPQGLIVTYRMRAAQFLILSNYTKPGHYKVEAFLSYLGTEYLKSSDNQISVSIILGITVRLAMHMGYHRDSKHYKYLSTFDGEMRRRVWAVLTQIDHLVSFQSGLPRIVPNSCSDTGLPHNLLDEDFDTNTVILPNCRPSTERTPAAYLIGKSKLVVVFGQIVDRKYSLTSSVYEEVLRLDKSLRNALTSLPPFLRIRPMNLSITDPPDLLIQRYNLELLYQKALCVLHRVYLTLDRLNPRYAYSRRECVKAALQILQHQSDIYDETQPGGQLFRERWFVSSFTTHDFLLAAMIICLEVSCNFRRDPVELRSEAMNSNPENQQTLLRALEISYNIWTLHWDISAEARKASRALAAMLQHAQRAYPAPSAMDRQMVHVQLNDSQDSAWNVETQAGPAFDRNLQQSIISGDIHTQLEQNQASDHTAANISYMMGIDEGANNLEEFDWYAWDNMIQVNDINTSC